MFTLVCVTAAQGSFSEGLMHGVTAGQCGRSRCQLTDAVQLLIQATGPTRQKLKGASTKEDGSMTYHMAMELKH